MANITAQEVVKLRQMSGCGMMECKKALIASDGDVEGAMEWLRKAGAAKAAKRAERSANQGKWAVANDGSNYALIEALCETDFVAKTADFAAFADEAAKKALAYCDNGDVSAKLLADMDDATKALIGKLGENMKVRRSVRWTAAEGNRIGFYLHPAQPFACMVEVSGPVDDALLNNICLHITASNPQFITSDDIPADFIAKEREIAAADPKIQGKPEQIREGIIKGKLNKRFTELCLMDMPWIDDDKTTLAKFAPQVKVVRFVRWLVGEESAQ